MQVAQECPSWATSFSGPAGLCLTQGIHGAVVDAGQALIAVLSCYAGDTPGPQRIGGAEVDTQTAANAPGLVNRQHESPPVHGPEARCAFIRSSPRSQAAGLRRCLMSATTIRAVSAQAGSPRGTRGATPSPTL